MYLRKASKQKREFDLLTNHFPQEFNFVYCRGYIDKQIKKFIFRPNEENELIDIEELDLLLINKIIITKQTKNKVILLQLAKKQENFQEKYQVQKQKNTIDCTDECLNEDKNKQYLQSRYFIFYLDLKNGERIEIILNTYENFKIWINGISSILQSKSFHV